MVPQQYINNETMMRGATEAPEAANGGNHALQDYQMQLVLLEQQNKKRLLMARQEQDTVGPDQELLIPDGRTYSTGQPQRAMESKHAISKPPLVPVVDCERASMTVPKRSIAVRVAWFALLFSCLGFGYGFSQLLIYRMVYRTDVPTLIVPEDESSSLPIIADECPMSDGQKYQTFKGDVYRKRCGVDWPIGGLAANHAEVVWDVAQVKTSTFDDCIDACSDYNSKNPAHRCAGVSWGPTPDPRGGCWLKANVGVDHVRKVDERSSAELLIAGHFPFSEVE